MFNRRYADRRSGRGGGLGFGFRGSSPHWPYVGRGRGGLPRCSYYLGAPASFVPAPYYPGPARYDDTDAMKSQAEALRTQLEDIESRIRDREAEA